MHYSKENAELYKQQKAAGKAAAPADVPVPGQGNAQKAYAIPGADSGSASYAIPGQTAFKPVTVTAAPNPSVQTPPQPKPSVQTPPPQKPPVQTVPPQSQPPPNPTVQTVQTPPQPKPPVTQIPPTNVTPPAGNTFGQTTVLSAGSGDPGTTVLGAQPAEKQVVPHLTRTKNNERIPIPKPVFRIGKERSYVDYFVSDNPAVSRSHADIIQKNGEYFILDNNSTNHTFVNGSMIPGNTEVKIGHGTKIILGNEEFLFELY